MSDTAPTIEALGELFVERVAVLFDDVRDRQYVSDPMRLGGEHFSTVERGLRLLTMTARSLPFDVAEAVRAVDDRELNALLAEVRVTPASAA
ncbi:hypothetical protein [Tsukamurella pseudospumae]|nr:hypothetical protein [Tsukamurella pseudospumae]